MTTLRIEKLDESDNLISFQEITTGVKAQIMKDNFIQAIQRLYFWRKDICQTNFTSMLYILLNKADDRNKMKIFVGFPEETIAYLLWYTNKEVSEATFFCKWLNFAKSDDTECETRSSKNNANDNEV